MWRHVTSSVRPDTKRDAVHPDAIRTYAPAFFSAVAGILCLVAKYLGLCAQPCNFVNFNSPRYVRTVGVPLNTGWNGVEICGIKDAVRQKKC